METIHTNDTGPDLTLSFPSTESHTRHVKKLKKLFRRRTSVVWQSHQPHPDLQHVTTH
jgi:hypothetical protein